MANLARRGIDCDQGSLITDLGRAQLDIGPVQPVNRHDREIAVRVEPDQNALLTADIDDFDTRHYVRICEHPAVAHHHADTP